MQSNIPFLDLQAQHAPLRSELAQVISEVIESGAFAGGPFVEAFEQDFARFCECEHAVGVGNGTDALWLALLACGIGQGDEVITVPNTFIATAEAISFCGATPVFVDVDERTYTMNPGALEKAVTAKTKAIIPVHLFGQMSDMNPILDFARAHDVRVIEDAAQAHGAEYRGRRAGSLGAAGCFSFYPGKNLGAFGEAGAVVTNDRALAEKIRILRDHGQVRKYQHAMVGWNCRMDGIQGAVLKVKLRHLAEGNRKRREHAAYYNRAFASVEAITPPLEADYAKHIYHIYAIRVPERDRILQALQAQGIGCGIHYPVPIHLQEAYRALGYGRNAFPVSEEISAEFLSLPMFPELTEAQLSRVAEAVEESLVVGAVS
jgi:dTDP-4-amino-4,6-dideoxygalactose transaminase